MDSRQYVFIYPLKTNTDIPADFPREFRNFTFEAGVFLPQDDSKWFTRQLHPARLLLLGQRALYIVAHPSSGQPPVEIKLDDLFQLETGCILLLGWMSFTTARGVQQLIYNTRGSQPLEMFLRLLKGRWLENTPLLPKRSFELFGDDLDVKFTNAVHLELDRNETPLLRFFQAPVPIHKQFLFFRREGWRAANVLLLTSMNRLVWITDQYRSRRERYASVSFSAPLRLLTNCTIENTSGQPQLAVSFSPGFSWRMPVFGALNKCFLFCDRLKQISEAAGYVNVWSESRRTPGLSGRCKPSVSQSQYWKN